MKAENNEKQVILMALSYRFEIVFKITVFRTDFE